MAEAPNLLRVTVTTVVPNLSARTLLLRHYGDDFRNAPAYELDLHAALRLQDMLKDMVMRFPRRA
jgi:hypothetical protein